MLQTAFEIERVALIKGTASQVASEVSSSADHVWSTQVSLLEEQRRKERARSADLLVDAQTTLAQTEAKLQARLAETENRLHACATELQKLKEKHEHKMAKWQDKWDGFQEYRVAVRRKEAELAQKKQALREWSQQHMAEMKQFIAEHHAEKVQVSRATEAAQQVEAAAAESVAAKEDELSYAKRAAVTARRQRADASGRLVAAEAVLRATKSDDMSAAGAEASDPVSGAGAALALLLSGGMGVGDALGRSREVLAVTREAEEAAVLSLDYDIDSLLKEFQQELRV